MAAETEQTYKCSEVIKTCAYRGFISSWNTQHCDYIGVTGHRRGCDPEHCTRYKYSEKPRKPMDYPYECNC